MAARARSRAEQLASKYASLASRHHAHYRFLSPLHLTHTRLSFIQRFYAFLILLRNKILTRAAHKVRIFIDRRSQWGAPKIFSEKRLPRYKIHGGVCRVPQVDISCFTAVLLLRVHQRGFSFYSIFTMRHKLIKLSHVS